MIGNDVGGDTNSLFDCSDGIEGKIRVWLHRIHPIQSKGALQKGSWSHCTHFQPTLLQSSERLRALRKSCWPAEPTAACGLAADVVFFDISQDFGCKTGRCSHGTPARQPELLGCSRYTKFRENNTMRTRPVEFCLKGSDLQKLEPWDFQSVRKSQVCILCVEPSDSFSEAALVLTLTLEGNPGRSCRAGGLGEEFDLALAGFT